MSEDFPVWMTGHVDYARELERRKAEAELAREEALEEGRRERARREAEAAALGMNAKHMASVMAQDTYQRLLSVSAKPDAIFQVTFSWHVALGPVPPRYGSVVEEERRETTRRVGEGWLIRNTGYRRKENSWPEFQTIPGLWLDTHGQLRTNRYIAAGWKYRFSQGDRNGPAAHLPSPAELSKAYPLALWGERHDPEPLELDLSWEVGGLKEREKEDETWRTWPYRGPSDRIHCAECGPGTPLVHVDSRPTRDDMHADTLARNLVMLLSRHHAL